MSEPGTEPAPTEDPGAPDETAAPTEPTPEPEPTTPDEPAAPETGEDVPGDGTADGETEGGPTEPGTATEGAGSSFRAPAPSVEAQKRQQDKDRAKLEKENERHDARVREIMGEDAQYLVNCPLCGDVSTGFLMVGEQGIIGEDKLNELRDLLGIASAKQLKQHPTVHTCETCDGLGRVATGSKVTGYDSIDCPECVGKGWTGQSTLAPSAAANGAQDTAPALTGPTVYADAPHVPNYDDDPAVQSLKERGFMVIPPMTINAT